MIYKGSCHCGRITFEAEGKLEKVIQCNCSICSKRGSLHWFISQENFRLLTPEEDIGTYTFSINTVKHRYCPTCGCATYSEGTLPSGAYGILINARCLDGVDLASVNVLHFDGRSL